MVISSWNIRTKIMSAILVGCMTASLVRCGQSQDHKTRNFEETEKYFLGYFDDMEVFYSPKISTLLVFSSTTYSHLREYDTNYYPLFINSSQTLYRQKNPDGYSIVIEGKQYNHQLSLRKKPLRALLSGDNKSVFYSTGYSDYIKVFDLKEESIRDLPVRGIINALIDNTLYFSVLSDSSEVSSNVNLYSVELKSLNNLPLLILENISEENIVIEPSCKFIYCDKVIEGGYRGGIYVVDDKEFIPLENSDQYENFYGPYWSVKLKSFVFYKTKSYARKAVPVPK